MFDKLRKVFSRDTGTAGDPSSELSSAASAQGSMSRWAASHGFAVSMGKGGQTLTLQGRVQGRPWLMEQGKPSRNYIRAEELRARAELGLTEDAAVLLINRPLKEALERKAYSMITDTLQTTADPNLPEEMRWLSLYEEYAWEALPRDFWSRYAVLADRREHASAFIDGQLAQLLLDWPEPAPSAEVPLILMLMRGKVYMRMEYTPAELSTLEHATTVFTTACGLAIASFSTDLPL